MKRMLIIISAILMLCPALCHAQKWAIGTNAADWMILGTINLNASVALAKNITMNSEARVNPWTFHKIGNGQQMQHRHQTYSIGMRWWPWYVYSGWWVGTGLQYQEYNKGGLIKARTEEGDAFGLTLSGGWSVMLHKHLNLELGASLWGGYTIYTAYACPKCGKITDSGKAWFILPSSIIASFIWVF